MDNATVAAIKTECQRQGCNEAIALATIDSETGGANITGDNGNAVGYGQVWPQWHAPQIQAIAAEFGITVPMTNGKVDIPAFTQIALANNDFCLAYSVKVIKDVWEGSGQDWSQFTYNYVGSGIASSTFQKRQSTYNQWNNSNGGYSVPGAGNSPAASTSYYGQFPITSAFGSPRDTGPHSGMDLGMPVGTSIIAIAGGTVINAGEMAYTGYTVIIQDTAGNQYTFGHLSQIGVKQGDTVSAGAQLGLSGGAAGAPGAGNSTGPHLHLGVKTAAGVSVDPKNYTAGSTGGSKNGSAFYGPLLNVDIPVTSFQVIKGSVKIGDTLYGRKYRVIVSSLDGSVALDVSQLRCVFSCFKTITTQPQFSTIVIYNLSPNTENTIIQQGYRIVIEAGYEGGQQYGLIFDGNVVMPIREKENGTDYKLTLIAMDSDLFLASGTANFSMIRGENSRSQIEKIIGQCSVPVDLGSISDGLSASKLTRGKVVFGLANEYLRQIAQSENCHYYTEDGKVNIIKPNELPDGEIIELNPRSGLIGVPTQKDYGATIKMLLNPKVKIAKMIHVDSSLIRNQQFNVGQPIYMLDTDGIYRVITINHVGDTRGNDWYTSVETVSQTGIQPQGSMPDFMGTPNTKF